MKRCPQCRRDYYDESLLYCLDDGSALLDGPASGEAVTAIHSSTSAEEATKQFNPTVLKEQLPQATARTSLVAGLISIGLITVLGVGSFLYFGRDNSRSIDSIAVMPFTNESGNPEVEYLSDGIPESLISSLSRLPNLTVKPRSSVFRYKGKMPEPKVLGEELNVQSILIGTVVQRGSDLNLNIELVDASTERVLWSEVYKRPLANLVSLQTEIARNVSAELRNR